MRDMTKDFFLELYSGDPGIHSDPDWPKSFPSLSRQQFHFIQQDVTEDEVKRVMFDMGLLKVPGPDGIQVGFLQKHWQVVHSQIFQIVLEAFQNSERIREVNETYIVLISKVDTPVVLKGFRPISLCNVCYKYISKVLANRLKGFMNFLVKENPYNFVGGRLSCDNIIIAQEVIHTMRTRRTRSRFVTIKMDM